MAGTLKYPLEKVEGMFMGIFLGDALGAPFDGCDTNEITRIDEQYVSGHPPKTYTDDTQMCISVFEEMLENGHIDQRSLTQRFLRRFSPWRGYTGGMLEVIEKWKDGQDIGAAARSLYGGQGSFGDGAAVRAAPISPFFDLDQAGPLVEQVLLCSLVTHTHPFGISGAALLAYSVLLALNDIPADKWLQLLFSFPTEGVYKIKIEKIKRCLEREASPHESARQIGNGSYALDAVPASLYAVLRNPGSFADAVLFAVSMGGDTDTIGAMTGALAGARSGLGGIPSAWLTTLENGFEGRDFIAGLIHKAFRNSG